MNPASDAQTVLHALQQRLNRLPEQRFSAETLQARADLLRASADVLCSAERRGEYEASLTALAAKEPNALAALDIPSNLEVGGLLLLLEAGQAQDCFDLALRSLQPPRTPVLGSGREADLTLLAALACLEASEDLHRQRRYETAAQLLVQGLQLLQSTAQHPLLRQQLQDELDSLQPFRVLDLLSRDLVATSERAEGLALLDALVQRRGGLEADGDPRLPKAEFQAFFRQIRSFLTVQEQLDLFSRWGNDSSAAHFLATTALTASGFARRKPEQIAAALARLQASGQAGTQPLQAALQLLLGNVDQGLTLFAESAPAELRQWAKEQSSDPLAQLCAYTSDWLARDVLPGYRDLEANPDLEAYFADRDVQAYVEQRDQSVPESGDRPGSPNPFAHWAGPEWGAGGSSAQKPTQQPTTVDRADEGFGAWESDPVPDSEEDGPLDLRLWLEDWLADRRAQVDALKAKLPSVPFSRLSGELAAGKPRWLGLAALATVLVAGSGALLLRSRQTPPTPIAVQIATPTSTAKPASKSAVPTKPKPAPVAKPAPPAPLTVAEPSSAQLQALLQAWLSGKAAVLSGAESSIPLTDIARGGQVSQVRSERESDAARNQTQRISTTVRSLDIEDRSPQRIAVIATIDYSDQRLDGTGQAIGQPSSLQLRNRYVFARDGERWLMASFQRAD